MRQTALLKRMMMMLLGAFLLHSALMAAPRLQQGAIVNAASFAVDGAPNAGIARGSLFTVFGEAVGPQNAVTADVFPLPTTLGGVSIKITAGGNDYAAVMLFANASQVSAILPSAVPAGQATLVLTYNNEASNPITFTVVERQVGIFSRTQTGTGLAVVQNFISPSNQPTNTLNQAAQPGQVLILWGTGLGASIDGNDTNAPAPGNVIPLNQIKVYVGGKEAQVQYAGRSGCCSGVDQINFVVPEDVEGCFVPVVVTADGRPSNFASISVAKNDTVCSDQFGLSKDQILSLVSRQTMRVGSVTLTRSRTEVSAPVIGSLTTISEIGTASFQEFNSNGLLDTGGVVGDASFAVGSCSVTNYPFDTSSAEPPEPPEFAKLYLLKGLDAGTSISVNNPTGARQLPTVGNEVGVYSGLLNNPQVPGDSYLVSGDYTVNNGAGGADVKAFSFTKNVPSFLNWLNRNAINSVPRNQGLTVTWTPNASLNGSAVIFGLSYSVSKKVASSLFCFADPGAGTFTVPAYVLSSMVASDSGQAIVPGGSLSVGGIGSVDTFTADGLDVGIFAVTSLDVKSVNYQ